MKENTKDVVLELVMEQEEEYDYSAPSTIFSQSLYGMEKGETIFIFTEEQLNYFKENSKIPFCYSEIKGHGYTIFTMQCAVYDEDDNIHFKGEYNDCVRYCKRNDDLKLSVEVVDDDVEYFGFEPYKNY